MMKLGIVSPCYNEEEVLAQSALRLEQLFSELIGKGKISQDSFVLLVNDGSKDSTWSIIEQLHKSKPFIKGLDLAHNVGHQCALMAGMMTAKDWADGLVTIDADLQDDLGCIEKMIDAYNNGNDVVYGVKVSRTADSFLKRKSAEAFYKLQMGMGVDTVYNHADFRFLSRRVLQALSNYPERNLYLRGMVPLIGFKSTTVDDIISERQAGVSKYTLGKMINLAIDGISSFSTKPLGMVVSAGIIFILVSLAIACYVIYSLIVHTAVPGWASLMLSIWLVGGAVLLALGVVGMYVGKIYAEVKRRPLYNVKEILD